MFPNDADPKPAKNTGEKRQCAGYARGMQIDRLRVVSTWYFETGASRYRVEVYEHEPRRDFGWHLFENENGGGIYRLVGSDSRWPDAKFHPWPTPDEALAAAQDQICARLEYYGKDR